MSARMEINSVPNVTFQANEQQLARTNVKELHSPPAAPSSLVAVPPFELLHRREGRQTLLQTD